ncbi:MAG: YfcE family phosphodiesterase, partial [Eubacteriales bacterium]
MAKTILVLSDSHENTGTLKKALSLCPDADLIVHLGDGIAYLTFSLPDDTEKRTILIEGNGEYFGNVRTDARNRLKAKKTVLIEFEGKKIFMTHGHLFDVKWGLSHILARGYEEGADIILFGHTHRPLCRYVPVGTPLDFTKATTRPILLFNPGTVGRWPEYTFGVEICEDLWAAAP